MASKVKVPRLSVISCLVLAACSGDRVNEVFDELTEALTTNDRILGFEGSIGGAGADWAATTGTATSSSTHSEGSKGMALGGNQNPQANSAAFSALGTLSGNPSIDVYFPTGYANQGSYWGNAQVYVTCSAASLINVSIGGVNLSGPAGSFHTFTFSPLNSQVASALSTKNGCTASVRLGLSNTGSVAPVVDRLFFGQTSGSGGTGGTGGLAGGAGAGGAGKSGAGGAGAGAGGAGKSGAGGAGAGAGGAGAGGQSGAGGIAGGVGAGGLGGKAGAGGAGYGGAGGVGGNSGGGGAGAGGAGSGGAGAGGAGAGGAGGSSAVEFFFKLPKNVTRESVALDAYGSTLMLGDYSKVQGSTGGWSSVSDVANPTQTSIGISAEAQSAWSQANLLMKNNSRLHGNATSQGIITKQSGALVDGTSSPSTVLDPLQRPAWMVTFPGGTLPTQTISVNTTLSPGSYGATTVKNPAKLTLIPGQYTFTSLTVQSGATLGVNNATGAVLAYVQGAFTWNGTVLDQDTTKNNWLLGVAGTGAVTLATSFRGVLVAPYTSMLTLSSCTPAHSGAFFANAITLANNAIVKHRPFTSSNFCTVTSPVSGLCPGPAGVGCDDDFDCVMGVSCCGGTCGGSGCSCATVGDCTPGLLCTSGICAACVPVCGGKACGAADGCTGTCRCDVGGICTVDSDCKDGLACKNGVCSCVPECDGKTCGASDECGGTCKCGRGEPGCTSSDQCEADLACSNGTCAPPICLKNPIMFGCGYEGAPCGPCTKNPVCTSNADCPAGLVCPPANGDHYLLPGLRVCELPGCLTDPVTLGCGTPTDPCGVCPACIPQCEGKGCGDSPDDGCGQLCTGLCPTDGTSPCEKSTDCQEGAVCLPADLTCVGLACAKTCRPAFPCTSPTLAAPNCGSASAVCGPSCPPPVADVGACADRQCGSDPLTGSSCGDCGGAELCTTAGRCAPLASDGTIQVPTGGSPATRPVTPPPAPPAVPVGATPGTFDVTDEGSASYTIPLEVPPGRMGIQPNFALSYSSASSNGALGIGWHIDGVSMITACGQSYAFDAQSSIPRGFEPLAGDSFCLDGQRLVPIGYPSSRGQEYRTAIDTFRQVWAENDGTGHVKSFTVNTREGRVLTYGGAGTTALVLGDASKPAYHTYALSKVADRSGNFMRFTYRQVPAWGTGLFGVLKPAETLLASITYTGHGDKDGDRELTFNYEGRDDTMSGVRPGGILSQRTKRLKSIEVRAQGQLVRRYDLGYDSTSGSSRLTSVQEAATNAPCTDLASLCKPATRFEYFDDVGFDAPSEFDLPRTPGFIGPPIQYTSPFGLVHDWARVDGWGSRQPLLPDLGPADERRSQRISSLSGSTSVTQTTPIPGAVGLGLSVGSYAYSNPALSIGSAVISLINFFGSEETEETYYTSVAFGPLFKHPTNPLEYIDESPPRWLYVREPTGGETVHDSGNSTWLVDVDGDGVQDKIWCAPETGKLDYALALAKNAAVGTYPAVPRTAQHAQATGQIDPIFPNICRCLAIFPGTKTCLDAPAMSFDVDGDGTSNLIFHDDEGNWAALDFSSGSPVWRQDWFESLDGVIAVKSHYIVPIDANGDGLRDLMALAGGYTECVLKGGLNIDCHKVTKPSYIAYATGSGFDVRTLEADPAELPPPDGNGGSAALHAPDNPVYVVDLDKDGKEELLEPGPDRLTNPSDCIVLPPLFKPDCRQAPRAWLTRRVLGSTLFRKPVPGLSARLGEVGDFDGDGNLDIIASGTTGSKYRIHRGHGRAHGLLKSATDGLGKRVEVRYDNKDGGELVWDSGLGDRTVDSPVDASCRWPYICNERLDAVPVSLRVDAHFQDHAQSDRKVDRQTKYRYKGTRSDLAGYGWLGFWERHEFVQDSNGSPLGDVLTTYVPPPAWVTGTSAIPYVHTTTGLVQKRVETQPQTYSPFSFGNENLSVTTLNTWNVLSSTASRPFPCLKDTLRTTYGAAAGGTAEPLFYRDESNTCDTFGNVKSKVTKEEDYAPGGTTVHGSLQYMEIDRGYNPTADEIGAWLINLPKWEYIIASPRCTDGENCYFNARFRYQTFEYYPGTTLLHFAHREPDEASGSSSPLRADTEYVRGDAYGNVTQTLRSEPDGNKRNTLTGYDSRGLFAITQTEVSDSPVDFQQTTETRYDDRFGKVSVLADANGIHETWSYDEFGRERIYEGPNGQRDTDQFATDYFVANDVVASGLPIVSAYRVRVSNAGGSSQETDYNPLDQIVRVAHAGYNGEPVVEELVYDSRQQLSRRTRPHVAGSSSQAYIDFTYDDLGRPLQEIRPDGSTTSHGYGLARFMSSNPDWITPTAIFVSRKMEDLGSSPPLTTAALTDRDEHGVRVIDGKGQFTDYAFGQFGEVEYIADSAGRSVSITHDAWSRPIVVEDAARGGAEFTSYNGFDQVVRVRDQALRTRHHVYDGFGRLDHTDDTHDGTTQWVYDGDGSRPNEVGRLVSTISPTGAETTYRYEAPTSTRNRGLMKSVSEHLVAPGDGSSTRDLTTDYTHDDFSRPERTDYPEASGSRVSVHYGYDAVGHVTEASDATNASNKFWKFVSADQGYRIKQERVGNQACGATQGTLTERSYVELSGELSTIHTTCNGATLQDLSYAYDLTSRMTYRSDASTGRTETFRYDDANRLTHIGTTEFYKYDPDGRGRLDQLRNDDGTVNAYSYQTTGRDWLEAAGPNTYTQDLVGDVRTRSVGGVTQTFDYTAFDMPLHVENGSTDVDFAYTAHGERAVKKSSTATTFYAGDRHQDIEETGGASHARSLIYVGSRAVAEVETNSGGSKTTHYLYDDALGSIHTVTSQSGAVESLRDYSPYGALRNSSSFATVPYGFTGHEVDPELGLINMKGRTYDPVSAQFLQPDPIVQSPASQGLNRFAYVNNAPLDHIDPTGTMSFGEFVGRVTEGVVLAYVGSYLAANFGDATYLSTVARSQAGALNGFMSGYRQIYDFYKSGSGYPAFILDSTMGITGTSIGNYVQLWDTIGGVTYAPELSERQDRTVFRGGFRLPGSDDAHTEGNVISNFGHHGHDLLLHETEHIWQNRLFGSFYQTSYLAWMGTFTLLAGGVDLMGGDLKFKDVKLAAYLLNPWEAHAYCRNPSGWNHQSHDKENPFCDTP